MRRVKISIVSYTNTIPFVYGLKNFFSGDEVDLQLDIPAVCAEKTVSGQAELGLVPVAVLAKNPHLKIVSDFCIGADGKVDSVCLYSPVPLQEIETILLDYQSRTSVELVKILCRELWKIHPEFKNAQEGFETGLSGKVAGVIIGDRTFALKDKYPFRYDLAEGWKELTGLPFVFATWATGFQLDPGFLKKLDSALQSGTENISDTIKYATRLPAELSAAEVEFYLKKRISYVLNDPKKRALELFLHKLKNA